MSSNQDFENTVDKKSKISNIFTIPNVLGFSNLLFFIVLTIIGIICNNQYQKRFEENEIKNRVITFRPKLELKCPPEISKIVLNRDTNWTLPKYDLSKRARNIDKISEVPMIISADITFTIINNREQITDVIGLIFFDTTSSIPQNEDKFLQENGKDSINEEPVQLDYLDTLVFTVPNYRINYISHNTFYLHLILFYTNQFGDLYDSYFVIKGHNKDLMLDVFPDLNQSNIEFLRINKIYLKKGFLRMESPKLYSNYLGSETESELGKFLNDKVVKHQRKKREILELLKKN